jgi:hypothetical protein
LKQEYFNLEYELANNKNFGMEVGRHSASAVSGVIAAIVIIIYLFVSLTKTSGSIF